MPGDVDFEGPVMPLTTTPKVVNNPFSATPWPNAAQQIPPRSTNPTTNPMTNPISQPTLSDQQLTERLALIEKQRQIKAYEDSLVAREAELARQQQALANQRFVESLKVNQNADIVPQFTLPSGPVAGTVYQPTGPVLARPDRYASRNTDDIIGNPFANGQTPARGQVNTTLPVPTSSVSKYAASLPGPTTPNGGIGSPTNKVPGNQLGGDAQSEQRKEKRTEGFIYFMLLCSLGLNVYLSLISRGFYVRYNELADELRETFTATM
jgi:hypothetical protein